MNSSKTESTIIQGTEINTQHGKFQIPCTSNLLGQDGFAPFIAESFEVTANTLIDNHGKPVFETFIDKASKSTFEANGHPYKYSMNHFASDEREGLRTGKTRLLVHVIVPLIPSEEKNKDSKTNNITSDDWCGFYESYDPDCQLVKYSTAAKGQTNVSYHGRSAGPGGKFFRETWFNQCSSFSTSTSLPDSKKAAAILRENCIMMVVAEGRKVTPIHPGETAYRERFGLPPLKSAAAPTQTTSGSFIPVSTTVSGAYDLQASLNTLQVFIIYPQPDDLEGLQQKNWNDFRAKIFKSEERQKHLKKALADVKTEFGKEFNSPVLQPLPSAITQKRTESMLKSFQNKYRANPRFLAEAISQGEISVIENFLNQVKQFNASNHETIKQIMESTGVSFQTLEGVIAAYTPLSHELMTPNDYSKKHQILKRHFARINNVQVQAVLFDLIRNRSDLKFNNTFVFGYFADKPTESWRATVDDIRILAQLSLNNVIDRVTNIEHKRDWVDWATHKNIFRTSQETIDKLQTKWAEFNTAVFRQSIAPGNNKPKQP